MSCLLVSGFVCVCVCVCQDCSSSYRALTRTPKSISEPYRSTFHRKRSVLSSCPGYYSFKYNNVQSYSSFTSLSISLITQNNFVISLLCQYYAPESIIPFNAWFFSFEVIVLFYFCVRNISYIDLLGCNRLIARFVNRSVSLESMWT